MHTSFESKKKASRAASKFWYVKATLRLRHAYHVFAYNEYGGDNPKIECFSSRG